MILWIVLILMLAVALVVVLSPQLRKRRRAASSRRDYDVAVYADQLRELKSDVERGVLSADQETQARLEIERRVLDADASLSVSQPPRRVGLACARTARRGTRRVHVPR